MSYTTPEDAQRPRAVYDIHPESRLSRYLANLIYFRRGFLTESFDFKKFKSTFVEIFPQL